MFKSPQQMLTHWEETAPDHVLLHQPVNRQWQTYSWKRVMDEARRIATALGAMGLEPGDRVGLISKNCAHWLIADFAIMAGGFVSVPIYPTANAKTIDYVLRHSEAKACFVGKLDDFKQQQSGFPEDLPTIAFPYPNTMPCDHRWDDLLVANEPLSSLAEPQAEDIMTLLYTSGSTGNPKGAVHNYASFQFVGTVVGKFLEVDPEDRVLSYLPLAHCTERAYVEGSAIYNNSCLYYNESLETFKADLTHCRPTFFGSVPRLWKKFQLGILQKMPQEKLDFMLKIPIVSGMVKKKVQAGLGLDQARWLGSGTAPIARALLEWWESIDMPIKEGWGMTETFAIGTNLPPGEPHKVGTIGKPLPEVDIKIGDNDEILIKCPSLMVEYYKEPEMTAEAFTEDGYLKTGDCGAIDSDGYVSITGRAKEIFKTAKGKYVAPVPIESLIAQNPLIEQACVVGIGRSQPVALVQLAAEGVGDKDLARQRLEDTLALVNGKLESHERLDRIIVVSEEWTPENELLTPTLKLKRDKLESKYQEMIEAEGRGVEFEAA
ncbi:MAG: AMP-binding protein [Xanthomonadales bacterium]|nr:AMP-binding protein [Xanthomonadales bacterium]